MSFLDKAFALTVDEIDEIILKAQTEAIDHITEYIAKIKKACLMSTVDILLEQMVERKERLERLLSIRAGAPCPIMSLEERNHYDDNKPPYIPMLGTEHYREINTKELETRISCELKLDNNTSNFDVKHGKYTRREQMQIAAPYIKLLKTIGREADSYKYVRDYKVGLLDHNRLLRGLEMRKVITKQEIDDFKAPNFEDIPQLQTEVTIEQHEALGEAVRVNGVLEQDHPERKSYTHIWKPHEAIEIRLSDYLKGHGVLHGNLEVRVRTNKRADKSNVTWHRGVLVANLSCNSALPLKSITQIYGGHKFIANAVIKAIDTAWKTLQRTCQDERLPILKD